MISAIGCLLEGISEAPEWVPEVLTICRTESPGCRNHGERGAAVKGADVVHVGVDVRVWGVKGRLRTDRWVPVGRDSDDGDIGKRRAACQRRGPGLKKQERKRN